MKVVIFAGGSGTRLWPLSRRKIPKQNQTIGHNLTLAQRTWRRVRRGFLPRDIYLSTTAELAPSLRKQLPELLGTNLIVEPAKRDTGPAVALTAAWLHKKNPAETMLTVWCDHFVKEQDEYIRLVKAADRLVKAEPDRTVLIGIRPKYADTGLGYIKMDGQYGRFGKYEVFTVDRFLEKPTQAKAEQYVADWRYLWNPAWAVFRVDAMLKKYRRWQPSSYAHLMRMQAAFGTSKERATLRRLFPKMEKISIDYSVFEHDRTMLVIPSTVHWLDIGNWQTVYDMLSEGSEKNIAHGRHVHVDSHGNLIMSYTGRLVATAGLRRMIIIDTPDAMLVCPRDKAQDVKKLVAELEKQQLGQYL